MRRSIAGGVVIALVAGAPAMAESAGEAMRAFGLVGTWAADCSIDIMKPCTTVTRCLGRITYTAPLLGAPTREFQSPTFTPGKVFTSNQDIDSAVRITVEKIRIITTGVLELKGRVAFLLPTKDEKWETIYEKSGDKMVVWSSQRTDSGKISIMDGYHYGPEQTWKPEDGPVKQWVKTDVQPLPPLERCLN